MKKIDLGQTIGILANVGVIAGIIFLAMELQQNNEMMRAQTRGELARDLMGMLLENVHDSALADILLRGDNGEELSEIERAQYENYMNAYVWYWANMFYQNQMGMYDADEFSVQMRIIRDIIKERPGWTEHWCEYGHQISTEFAMAVEGDESGEIC